MQTLHATQEEVSLVDMISTMALRPEREINFFDKK